MSNKRRAGPVRRYLEWLVAFFGINPQSSDWEESLTPPPSEEGNPKDQAKP